MKPVYIRWRDAYHGQEDTPHQDLGALAELHELGFLVKETPETYTISMEHQDGETSSRLWLTIPKVNVIEFRRLRISKRKESNAK